MREFIILYRKELKGYFTSPFGWVVLAFASVMSGLSLSTAMKGFTDNAIADTLVYAAFHTPHFWFSFLFLFPLITMKLFSEEERLGTIETLFTAPVTTGQVVLSKYAAAVTFYILLWVPSLFQFLAFDWITSIPAPYDQGSLIGSYSIIFLMGLYFTAIGCLASSLTSSQIIAGIVTIGILLLHYFLGYVTFIWGNDFAAAGVFYQISSQLHLDEFSRGVISSPPFVYYLSMTAFVLFITHHHVDHRRWKK